MILTVWDDSGKNLSNFWVSQKDLWSNHGEKYLNILDLTQCPRCLSREIVEVHGHYQCRCGFYVSECCQGECAQLKDYKKQLDQLDKMIEIFDSFNHNLLSKQGNV